tara:strand:- start:300 stop:428 length:129 start_codon:yes stop_codon:yes gene_type:complete
MTGRKKIIRFEPPEEPVMPADRKEELDEYVTRRRAEIGFDEP